MHLFFTLEKNLPLISLPDFVSLPNTWFIPLHIYNGFFFLSHLRRTHFCISYCTISYNEKKKRNKNLRRRPPFLVLGYIALVCRRRVLHVSVVVVVVMKFSEERRIQECFLSTFFFS